MPFPSLPTGCYGSEGGLGRILGERVPNASAEGYPRRRWVATTARLAPARNHPLVGGLKMPQDNSAPTARWFRLDAGWDKKDWIADLEPDARLAWVLLLCYVKVHGIRGKAVALTFRGAARDWRVPERAVAEMFDAAVEAGTVSFDEECWTIEDWTRYQPQDHTTGERSRRYRESRRDQA